MPTIAIVNIGAHGHVNATLPVTGELVRRGAEVTYFVPEEFRAAVVAEGAICEPYDSVFGGTPPAPGTPTAELMAQMPARLTDECLHVAPQIEARLRALKPDLVIYDKFCLAARFLAQSLGIKAATFLPSYAANQHFSLHKLMAPQVGPPLLNHPSMAKFRENAEAISKKFGVTIAGLPELFGHAEGLNVCFVAKAFQYEGDSFDSRFVFVGPCIDARPTAGRWQPPAGDDRPLVFASLGTVFNTWPEFFRMCFEAFADSKWHVLMAIGKNIDPKSLGTRPANVELAAHVPQLDVLQHAKAFITHGGMNSTMEALWFGVPTVVIPQMVEQAATAQRIAQLKLGRSFTRETIDAKSLRQAVDELVTDQGAKDRIAAMQREVRNSGGQKKAAEAILSYIK